MTTPATPPEIAGIERAVDAVLLALTAADLRGDIVGPCDFREALIRTHVDWVDAQVTPLLGAYVGDRWLPAEVVGYLSAAWSTVTVEYMAVLMDLLFQIERLTGKPPTEALRELRERVDQAVTDGE